jgi:hypothetical protein
MNESKLKRLFETARNEPSPAPGAGFEAQVMRAIRHEGKEEPGSLFDQLNRLFPRVAWAAVVVIGLCVAGDLAASALHLPGLTDGLAQLSDQWLFAVN